MVAHLRKHGILAIGLKPAVPKGDEEIRQISADRTMQDIDDALAVLRSLSSGEP